MGRGSGHNDGSGDAAGDARSGPERRCIASATSGPTDRLIRFVLGPGGHLVPDLAEKLPGRGVWLTADPAMADRAVKKRLFARAFRREVAVPDDLAGLLERLLAERLVQTVALARKAGAAVTGFEKVRARLGQGPVGALIAAADAAADGMTKLRRSAGDAPTIRSLGAGELGLAFGREFAIHAALDPGGLAARAIRDAARLEAFRPARGADGPPRAEAPAETGPGDLASPAG